MLYGVKADAMDSQRSEGPMKFFAALLCLGAMEGHHFDLQLEVGKHHGKRWKEHEVFDSEMDFCVDTT